MLIPTIVLLLPMVCSVEFRTGRYETMEIIHGNSTKIYAGNVFTGEIYIECAVHATSKGANRLAVSRENKGYRCGFDECQLCSGTRKLYQNTGKCLRSFQVSVFKL